MTAAIKCEAKGERTVVLEIDRFAGYRWLTEIEQLREHVEAVARHELARVAVIKVDEPALAEAWREIQAKRGRDD
jgi:hypothetical protein